MNKRIKDLDLTQYYFLYDDACMACDTAELATSKHLRFEDIRIFYSMFLEDDNKLIVTPSSFLSTDATTTQYGVVRYATDAEIANKVDGVAVPSDAKEQIINTLQHDVLIDNTFVNGFNCGNATFTAIEARSLKYDRSVYLTGVFQFSELSIDTKQMVIYLQNVYLPLHNSRFNLNCWIEAGSQKYSAWGNGTIYNNWLLQLDIKSFTNIPKNTTITVYFTLNYLTN